MNNFYQKKPVENQKFRSNLPKDYEDEQDSYIIKNTDNHETKELKSKLRMLIGKVANSKKEKEVLQK